MYSHKRLNFSGCSEYLNSMEQLISSGGDERLILDKEGKNMYFVNPLQQRGVFNRGSCTCSPITEDGYQAAQVLYNQLRHGELLFDEVKIEQRNKLLKFYAPHTTQQAQLFFAPSGSDLCYFPLLFSALLKPEKKILNVVTCPEELGSGSILAHQAKFYCSRSQFNTPLRKEAEICDDLIVEYLPLSARNHNGSIIDHSQNIKQIIDDSSRRYSVIVNLVVGSKSGIEDNLSIIDECRRSDVIWTVDLCQLRASSALAGKLLTLGCILLITGSKFYQAPPFCGALLVPQKYVDTLESLKPSASFGFDNLFSSHDFPKQVHQLRSFFPGKKNYGLMLRWEAGLREMQLFGELPETTTNATIESWNCQIMDALSTSQHFELLCDQDMTNKSIVSFRVKMGRRYLTHLQLSELCRLIATDQRRALPDYEKVHIGQPVSYSNGSFIRLALGSHDVRRFSQDGLNMSNDRRLVEMLETIAKENFCE